MRETKEEIEQSLNIIYLSHYYPPEVNAPALRVSEFAQEWKKSGHSVTIQTGFPNHPNGVIPAMYSGKIFEEENTDGVRILRSYVYATPNKGVFKRGLNYLSFMVSSVLLSTPRSGRADVVIGTSPQFLVAVAAWITAMFKRAPFVFEVRDLWPEEIVAVGAIHNKTIIRILEWIEMFLYRRASLIVAVAQGTIDTLVDRGVPREKITLLPNGVLLKRFENADGEKIRKQLKFDGEFLVSYIGTHGMAHKLETVVGAAEKLKHNNRIRFLMVGDGAEKIKLQKLVAEKGLTNMTFVPQIPSSEAPDYYSASDVCLAPLRNVSLFRRNIPSKLYEIMASGKPILLGAQGESQKLVETAKAGMTFEPENEDSLVDRINELFQNRELATRLGMQGREYVAENHQRKDVARRYIECIRTMLEANKR